MVEHVDTTSIAEVVVRLVGADDQRGFMFNNHMQVGVDGGMVGAAWRDG